MIGTTTSDSAAKRNVGLDLFLASFLALFLEVMFIRWVPSYERVLAYFTNFVLIAAFLGLGLGAMLTRWRRDLIAYQPILLAGLVAVALFFNQYVKTSSVVGDIFYSDFGRSTRWQLSLLQTLVFFFLLIAAEFVPIGQRIGRDLMTIKPVLHGYVLNILGSLLGVIAFAAASFFRLGPVWWFALVLLVSLWFVRGDKSTLAANAMIGLGIVAAVGLAGASFIWSPYHKLVVSPIVVGREGIMLSNPTDADPKESVTFPREMGFHIAVDDDFLQMAMNLTATNVAMYPFLKHFEQQYDLAYSIPHLPHDDVLIVGAGTGNDTAAALRNGALRIDAVEIDPSIVDLGKSSHPEHPYKDPRVHAIVDDARSYFNKTNRKYDLVVFGLLDSHRLFSGMSSVRLDSFVFTVQSFQEVRSLLKPDGIAVVQHGLGAEFMAPRMYRMLTDAFGTPPQMMDVRGLPGLTYLAGPGVSKYFRTPRLIDTGSVSEATDDWPFFYLRGRTLPPEYKVALVAIGVLSLLCVVACSGGKMRAVDLHFFFLGSAFLLIETLSVTRFALLFGSTWMVNSIVFSAILLVVLLANLWMERLERINVHLLYPLLGLSVLLNYLFPVHLLLNLGLALRLMAAMALLATPLFFAALIFARSYKQTAAPELAFASNLLGAVVGGLLEYSSLVIGFRNQLLIALALYALSYAALALPARKPQPLLQPA